MAARVALVTGAARGIGAATVRVLAAQGWAVLAVDQCADDPALPYRLGSRDELDEVVAKASAAGPGTALAHVADVRDEGQLSAAVAAADRQWGGLDAAVAVAGVIAGGVPLWEMPADQARAVLDTDLGGVINLARAAIPALLRRPAPRSGRFLAVASAAATRGLPMLAAYCAAKAGVILLTQTMALELGASGIAVNAVCPGTVDTDLLNKDHLFENMMGGPEGLAAYVAREVPLGRLQDAEEIAAAICWLLSDAARGVTGEALNVSAGQTMV